MRRTLATDGTIAASRTRITRALRRAQSPPTGPLPVGRWQARDLEEDGPAAGPGPGPATQIFRADPLAGTYRREAEQGFLPEPDGDDLWPEPSDGGYEGAPLEREYGPARGRS